MGVKKVLITCSIVKQSVCEAQIKPIAIYKMLCTYKDLVVGRIHPYQVASSMVYTLFLCWLSLFTFAWSLWLAAGKASLFVQDLTGIQESIDPHWRWCLTFQVWRKMPACWPTWASQSSKPWDRIVASPSPQTYHPQICNRDRILTNMVRFGVN